MGRKRQKTFGETHHAWLNAVGAGYHTVWCYRLVPLSIVLRRGFASDPNAANAGGRTDAVCPACAALPLPHMPLCYGDHFVLAVPDGRVVCSRRPGAWFCSHFRIALKSRVPFI